MAAWAWEVHQQPWPPLSCVCLCGALGRVCRMRLRGKGRYNCMGVRAVECNSWYRTGLGQNWLRLGGRSQGNGGNMTRQTHLITDPHVALEALVFSPKESTFATTGVCLAFQQVISFSRDPAGQHATVNAIQSPTLLLGCMRLGIAPATPLPCAWTCACPAGICRWSGSKLLWHPHVCVFQWPPPWSLVPGW